MYFSRNAMNKQTNERNVNLLVVLLIDFRWELCAIVSPFWNPLLLFSKHLGQKPYLFAAHIPEIGYKRKCPSSPQRKRYPTLAAWRVQKSRDSESNTLEKYEMLRQSNRYSKYENIWQPYWDRVSNGLNIGSKRIYLTQSFSMNRLSRILSSK